jgi:DNA-binding response OmpR family regulator
MLTAKQLTPVEAQEYGIYVEDYILKPITPRELYEAIEHVLNRRRNLKQDVETAIKAGFGSEIIAEYARLVKSIDVNRRLKKILENTYHVNDSTTDVNDDISRAFKSMETNIQLQEIRLQQIKSELAGVIAPSP